MEVGQLSLAVGRPVLHMHYVILLEMKYMLLLLALAMAAFPGSHAQCIGEIRVLGIERDNFVAGQMEICADGEWRAVCHGSWDMNDAMVACRQLGFPSESTLFCLNSCFGQTERPGFHGFGCSGTEDRLQECSASPNDMCGQAAGVVCYNMTLPPDITRSNLVRESCPSLAAVGGVLGTLCAILAILLVGVVTAWVWSYYRKKGKEERKGRPFAELRPKHSEPNHDATCGPDETYNPSYGVHLVEPDTTSPNPSYKVHSTPEPEDTLCDSNVYEIPSNSYTEPWRH